MRRRLAGSFLTVFVVFGSFALSTVQVSAQYSQPSLAQKYESGWESERIRVRAVSVEPGGRLAPAQDGADRVIVFLTADFQGEMPRTVAIWQPDGDPEIENRSRYRVDAIVIDLKRAPTSTASGTPPEALPLGDGVDNKLLIDNPRVVVTKLRYRPYVFNGGWLHFHMQDALVVYLTGGNTWLPFSAWGYPARVHRGEFDVVPAHAFHSFANAGGDPLEFLAIFPK